MNFLIGLAAGAGLVILVGYLVWRQIVREYST